MAQIAHNPVMTQHAFSLIELLIVLALISILAAVSYPSYQHYIAKMHRNRAQIALLEAANRLEEQHALTGTYKNSSLLSPLPHFDKLPYQFILHTTQSTYQITAVPIAAQKKEDTECGILRINETGRRTSTKGC